MSTGEDAPGQRPEPQSSAGEQPPPDADAPEGASGNQEASEPSEEQLRQYVEQLRSAPVEQVVAELLGVVLNAARAKVGRRDARLMIDLAGLMSEHVCAHVSDDLAKQVDQTLGQLRFEQVDAERQRTPGSEPNDLERAPTPPSSQPASSQPVSSRPPQQQSDARSRLWVPGQ